jgi:hypothetical protein
MNDYILHQSQYIVDNIDLIKEDIAIAHRVFKQVFPADDSTWSYHKYNVFALTAPSSAFHQIYKELRTLIRSQLGDDRPLWIQAWINYHSSDEMLDWHAHEFEYHGYISIEPKNTNTIFENYTIKNEVGQIYFAPGYRKHKVELIEPFEGIRTTIGYDVHTLPLQKYVTKYIERPFGNMSLIPLL